MLTNLTQNFEPEKVSPLVRPLVRITGAMFPDGRAPCISGSQSTGREKRPQQLIEKLVAWAPQRFIFAHGPWFNCDGAAKRALRGLTD